MIRVLRVVPSCESTVGVSRKPYALAAYGDLRTARAGGAVESLGRSGQVTLEPGAIWKVESFHDHDTRPQRALRAMVSLIECPP